MASATDTRLLTTPGTLKATEGPWIVIEIPKATLVMSRRIFLECLAAGKRWRRRQQFDARHQTDHEPTGPLAPEGPV